MQEQMIMEIAQRIRTLREIMEIPIAEMAQQTGLSADEYVAYEQGQGDFTFTFLPRKQKRNNSAERNKNELCKEIKMSWVLTL